VADVREKESVVLNEPDGQRPAWRHVWIALAFAIATLASGCGATSTALPGAAAHVADPSPNASSPPSSASALKPSTTSVPAPTRSPEPNKTCASLSVGTDGTVAPLYCSDGSDNPAALAYYDGRNRRGFHPLVLRLPATATRRQVISAVCSDLAPGSHMGLQSEQQAYDLAARRARWPYHINTVNGLHCTAPSSSPTPAA
jgi:hypothetical protein